MMAGYAILNGHEVVPCSAQEWGRWFGRHEKERIVAKTHLQGFLVSTVFLAIDHGWKSPLWFETMIFKAGPPFESLYCERYETWEEAEAGHRKAVEAVRNKEIPE